MCIELLTNDNVLILSVIINKYIDSIKLHLIVFMGIISVTTGCCGVNTKMGTTLLLFIIKRSEYYKY